MELMEHFMQLFGELPRAGPGDGRSTAKALGMVRGLPANPTILDVGCGPGVQTLDLARLTDGRILAMDLMSRMVERTKEAVEREGVGDRVRILRMDMNEMGFTGESFDLVWSEGAIYLMGFQAGLEKLRPLVKKGGHVAVSEAIWLKPDPPEEVRAFWQEYPEIDTVESKIEIIQELGYLHVGSFVLPPECWTREYYDPLQRRADFLEEEWKTEPEEVKVILQEARREIDMFRRFHDYYGYCFFVMKRTA